MKVELKVKPFQTPNFAILEMPPADRGDGFPGDSPSLPLSALTADTLDELCNAFRREVFKKAGKLDPEFGRASATP